MSRLSYLGHLGRPHLVETCLMLCLFSLRDAVMRFEKD